MKRAFLICAFALTFATPAFADIPVDDAQQLTQKLQTSATTTTLVPVQQKHRDGQKGIDCATHTGQQGATQNNTATPSTSAGTAAIQKYDPQCGDPAAARRAQLKRRKPMAPPPEMSSPAIWRRNRQSSAMARPIKARLRSLGNRRRSWPATTRIRRSARRTASAGTRCSPRQSAGQRLQRHQRDARLAGQSAGARYEFHLLGLWLGAVPNNAVCGAGFRGSGTANDPASPCPASLQVAARWWLLGASHHGFLRQRCRLSRTRAIAIGEGLDHETDDMGFGAPSLFSPSLPQRWRKCP